MPTTINVFFENGVFRPVEPIAIQDLINSVKLIAETLAATA
jgi:predicted DNA-binding antitoxin AbrB/MazE fold protein